MIDLQILEGRIAIEKWKNIHYLSALDVVFGMCLLLKGKWYAGRLRAYGHGYIGACR
jgi:hypothetical protein